jgi:hypothetical protein
MKTITVRGISDRLEEALKKVAGNSHTSVNKTIVALLEDALGFGTETFRIYHDLDHLAGTWTEEEYAAFQDSIREFEQIEEDLWK